MARYLSKEQIRNLLNDLDGNYYQEISSYRNLKQKLVNSLGNYTGKMKYNEIKKYINHVIIPERINNLANDLEIFNSYKPPAYLNRLTKASLAVKDNIIKQVNLVKDFNADFKNQSDETQETYLMGLIESLKSLKIKNNNKYLTLTLDYGNDNICMRVINSKTLEHIKNLIEILEGRADNDIDDFTESDQAVLFAFMKLQGFSLEWYSYEKKIKDGGYFPYFNLNMDLDLSIFGIYHNSDEANYTDNCFTTAAINSKLFTSDEIEYLRSLINTRYVHRDDLKEITNIFNIEIDTYFFNGKKIDKAVKFNTSGTRKLRLLIRCGHYMIYQDELVPENKYGVKNLNTLLTRMFENHEFQLIHDLSKAEKFIVSEFEFDKLEYPSTSIRKYHYDIKPYEINNVFSAVFSQEVFQFINNSIRIENLFNTMPNKSLIYLPDLKGIVFNSNEHQIKSSVYRNTVQQITLRNSGKVIYLRNFKSLTSCNCSEMNIDEFDNFRKMLTQVLKQQLNVNINDYSTLPLMTVSAAFKSHVFDNVYELSGIVKSFAQKCIRGGLVQTLYDKCFEVDDVTCLDINSSYGTSMANMNGIPVGKPKPFYKQIPDDACYFWVQVNIQDLTDDKLGVYGFIKPGINFIDSILLEEIKKYCSCKINIINGYYFNQGFNNSINNFARKLYGLRKINGLNKLGKNMLSSFYGKSLQNAQQFKIKNVNGDNLPKFISENGNYIYSITSNKNNIYTVKLLKALNLNFNVPQLGIQVLSYSRRNLNEIIYNCNRLKIPIYSIKTGSITINNNDVDRLPINIGVDLGEFKIEYVAKHIKFTSKKCYRAILTDGSIRMRGYVE